jgi:hypothetical protein
MKVEGKLAYLTDRQQAATGYDSPIVAAEIDIFGLLESIQEERDSLEESPVLTNIVSGFMTNGHNDDQRFPPIQQNKIRLMNRQEVVRSMGRQLAPLAIEGLLRQIAP